MVLPQTYGAALLLIVVSMLCWGSWANTFKLAGKAAKHSAAQGPRKTTGKGIALSLLSGVLMGSFFPLVEMGKAGPLGLGPYSIGFVFAVGVFLSTFVFNLFFMNFPVEDAPVA